jgi:hypothetical protein
MDFEYVVRRLAPLLYAAGCGALLYACIDQIASGQSSLAWISGTLLLLAAIVGVWNAMQRGWSD